MSTMMTTERRRRLDAEHKRKCWEYYNRGMKAVVDAIRTGLEDATRAPTVAELLELCRFIEEKAKKTAADNGR